MMTVPAETADIDRAIASFRAGVAAAAGEGLTPRGWSAEDWRELFRFTGLRRISAADALIRRGDPDRTLYFVLRGDLEVVIHLGDGISIGPLTRVGPGSVLGEQSFFDGNPRSASVWAVDECEVAAMTPDQYAAFAAARPGLARELLFALGRILAIRLRRTTARVMG
jgi:CRP/FNR family cyclic AMP-dependent transcriptional regulator